ncbi:MAG TPA: hypothetical protein PKV77_09550 [Bacteroidales bacterium]|nr:hypothetical protein [Bacteroidales bacterium]
MALTASPYGFLARKHPSGQSRANAYTLVNTATTIGYGDPVKLGTDGLIVIAAAADDIIGIFAGVQYRDATGKPNLSKNWPGSTAGATDIVAYVYDDAEDIFEVQVGAGGTGYVQAVIGAQADVVIAAPNAVTGQSTSYLNATPEAGAAQGQFRVIGFGSDGVYDATLNPFPTVLVQIAQHQYIANKVGI